jgi:type IX secretion system PorP/SprF family membrane protein
MKKYILILALMVTYVASWSQQEVMVSQYMFNGLLLNPAYAGSHDYFSASLLHRSQWVKFDKAPVTQVFAIDGPIANNRLGLGFLVSNDQIGITSQLDVSANLAYRLPLGPGNLSFGIKAGVASYSANFDEIIVWDEGDEVYVQNNISGEFVPKFGFGVYYNTDNWFAGISVPVIYSLDDQLLLPASIEDAYFQQHYYLNGGVVFEVNPALAIKPSVLIKYVPNAPMELDLNCNVLLYQRLWLGLGYRTGDAFVGMLEYNITPQLRAGYAYDFTTTEIKNYSSGSHEIMLGFDFGKNVQLKTRSPRYF